MEDLKIERNIRPFNGEGYSVWKIRIRSLLEELDVLKVIDDNIPVEPDEAWNQAERTAKGTIIEYLDDAFLGFADPESTSRVIFQKLDAIYERKSFATKLALWRRLSNLKFQEDTSLIKHFAIFDDLIIELQTAGVHFKETDKIVWLLLTLPASYDEIITLILIISEENLTLTFVKTRLLNYEVQLQIKSRDTRNEIMKNCDYNNRKQFKRNNQDLNEGKYLKQNRINSSKVKCYQCGRKGHVKKNCYYHKRALQYKNGHRNRNI